MRVAADRRLCGNFGPLPDRSRAQSRRLQRPALALHDDRVVGAKAFWWVSCPIEIDFAKSPELYSLPMLFRRLAGYRLSPVITSLPAFAILAVSATPLVFTEKLRLCAAVVAVCLCVLMHYLAYPVAYEYQYATLLPLLPAGVWLWQRESCA